MNKKVIFILCFVIIIVIGAVFLIKNIFENDVNNEELFYYPQNSGYLDVVLPTYKVSKNGDVEIKYVSDMCTFTLESQELENFKQDLDELRKLIHKPKNIKEDYTQEIYINNKKYKILNDDANYKLQDIIDKYFEEKFKQFQEQLVYKNYQ